MDIAPSNNAQSMRGFCLSLASLLLLTNNGCNPPAAKPDLRETAEVLAKKAEREEKIKLSQKENEQYFIAELQTLNGIEDKNSLYTKLIDLCQEASRYNCEQMLRRRGRSLEKFSKQLEEFAYDHLPNFKMKYDLPETKGREHSSFQKAVGDNQLYSTIEKSCSYLLKDALKN